jgi:hypothetical protein
MNNTSDMKAILEKLYAISPKLEQNFQDASEMLAEDAMNDIDLAVAINQTVTESSVRVHNYKIDIIPLNFAGRTKNFYNIIDLIDNTVMHKELALFETAMGIVKKYMVNTISGVKELEQLDVEYCNALYEVYMHKHKAKTAINEDISLAKVDNANRRLYEAKSKILKRL